MISQPIHAYGAVMTDAWTARSSLSMRFVALLLPVLRARFTLVSEVRSRRDIAASEGAVFAEPAASYRREFRLRRERFGPLDALVIEPHTAVASVRSLIWVHGGGYVHQFETAHWWLAASLVRALGARLIAPDYRLAPGGEAAQGLGDVSEFVRAVAAHDRAAPVLGGDSAGGGLAVSVALALRGDPARPVHLVLAAPWLDLTLSHPEIPAIERRDPSLACVGLRIAGQLWAGAGGARDPVASPAFAEDYSGLPPTSLVLGTRDILYPDARDFAASVRRCDVDVATFTAADAFHVFLAATRLPEARAARRWLMERLAPYWVV
jgi:acetyl esterase/lipase